MKPGDRFNPYKKFNGIFIPDWLAVRREISQGAKIAYGRLLRYAGKDGKCYPSIDKLANDIGVKKRQVAGYLKELKELKLIESIQRGRGHSNEYLFLFHDFIESFDMQDSAYQNKQDVQYSAVPDVQYSAVLYNKDIRESFEENQLRERGEALSYLFFLMADEFYQEQDPTPKSLIKKSAKHFSSLKDPEVENLIQELFTADHEPAVFWRNAVMNDGQKFCRHYKKIRAQFKSRATRTRGGLPFDDDFTQHAKPTKGDRAVEFLRRLNSTNQKTQAK